MNERFELRHIKREIQTQEKQKRCSTRFSQSVPLVVVSDLNDTNVALNSARFVANDPPTIVTRTESLVELSPGHTMPAEKVRNH